MIYRDPSYNVMYELSRMHDESYIAELSLKYPHAALVHSHTCKTCAKVITHTRLEAIRDGDRLSHTCCGKDVRK